MVLRLGLAGETNRSSLTQPWQKHHWAASWLHRCIAQSSNLISWGPRFCHWDAHFFPEQRFLLCSLHHPQPHTLNYHGSESAVAASPLKEFTYKRLPCEFRNLLAFPVNPDGVLYLSIGKMSENLHFTRYRTNCLSMTPSGQSLAIFIASPANPSAGIGY